MYSVFTDGSSSRKNKTIGTSYVIYDKNETIIETFKKGFKDIQARNGIAELLGVGYFLSNLHKGNISKIKENEDIVIYSDSEYVVKELSIWFRNQMVRDFFDIKNKEIIIYILYLLYQLRKKYNITFKWIKGHQKEVFKWVKGHKKSLNIEITGNNTADFLAVSSHSNSFSDISKLENVEFLVENVKTFIKKEDILNKIKTYY